jgi:hypothetical protein
MISQPFYHILAWWGGFGNHLRWLAMLDPKYQYTLGDSIVKTPDDKVNAIKQFVYPSNRNYNNWLQFEFKYRNYLNRYLKFTHDAIDVFDECKTILCVNNSELGYNVYSKMNRTLNKNTKEQYFQANERHNKFCQFASEYYQTTKIVDTSLLYSPILDKTVYETVCAWFALDNFYLQAQEIHQTWYHLHVTAENEYLTTQEGTQNGKTHI